MQQLNEILHSQEALPTEKPFDFFSPEYLEDRCKAYNETKGTRNLIDGYNCEYCNNRGNFAVVRGDEIMISYCEKCRPIRKSLKSIKHSGLDSYSFKSFECSEKWQRDLKQKVIGFTNNKNGNWLLISGQSGCGKTHLCTAAVTKMMHERSLNSVILRWAEDAKRLKRLINDNSYSTEINRYKYADLLYIDDFLKVKKGESPTPADINLAFELLDYRYNYKLTTIISSEFALDEIIDFDEALGGRIKQRCKDFCFFVSSDKSKNYRLR